MLSRVPMFYNYLIRKYECAFFEWSSGESISYGIKSPIFRMLGVDTHSQKVRVGCSIVHSPPV